MTTPRNVHPSLFRSNQGPGDCSRCYDSLLPIKVTPVYEAFWKFAYERQKIFFNKLEGKYLPWTDDPILQKYKFTNAYRASDRVSQYLIRNVIYAGPKEAREVFFRTILFKMFNKIETWKLIEREVGNISCEEYSSNRYEKILSEAMETGHRIYSAAYISPPGIIEGGTRKKHVNHLRLLEMMIDDRAFDKIAEASKFQDVFDILTSYPTIGTFLGYQYSIDLNYSEIIDFSENDFVVPGPGALNGIRKCFSDYGGLSAIELIRFVKDRQELEFERLGLNFKSLWGRPLKLIDCQNIFCEVDKYSRVAYPTIKGRDDRKRIKRLYKPSTLGPISFWYPPKWKINDSISIK